MENLQEKAHNAAVQFCIDHGYEIIKEKFDFPGFPVDLVVHDGNDLIFIKVQVKDSSKIKTNKPLTDKERRNFISMTLAFMDIYPDIEGKVRLDYISLFPMNGKALLEHHQNAEKPTL